MTRVLHPQRARSLGTRAHELSERDVVEVLDGLVEGPDSAVDLDVEVRALGLEPVDLGVAKGRDVAVLFG